MLPFVHVHSLLEKVFTLSHTPFLLSNNFLDENIKNLDSGGFAGMLGWTVAMPFDVPKTNVQSRWDTKVVGSYFPEMISIARKRGIIGLYDGLGPTVLRAFPANAALFLGVETGKKLFDEALWKE